MSNDSDKALDEGDLPRTPPGRPIAVDDGRNQAKEPLGDCVARRTLANIRQGMSRGEAVAKAIRDCEKSRPVRGGRIIPIKRNIEKIGEERRKGENLKDCVSRKIEILIGEGKPREQAAAIAFSQCRLRSPSAKEQRKIDR